MSLVHCVVFWCSHMCFFRACAACICDPYQRQTQQPRDRTQQRRSERTLKEQKTKQHCNYRCSFEAKCRHESETTINQPLPPKIIWDALCAIMGVRILADFSRCLYLSVMYLCLRFQLKRLARFASLVCWKISDIWRNNWKIIDVMDSDSANVFTCCARACTKSHKSMSSLLM